MGFAGRILQGVEELRPLEGEEFFRVEEREAVTAQEAGKLARGGFPEVHHVAVGGVKFLGEGEEGGASG